MPTNTIVAPEPALGQTWKDRDTRVGNGRSGSRLVKVTAVHANWPDHVWIQTFTEDRSPAGPQVKIMKSRLKKRFTFVSGGV